MSTFVAVLSIFLIAMALVAAEGGRRIANISRAEDLASEAARAAASTLEVGSLAIGEPRIDVNDHDGAAAQIELLLSYVDADANYRMQVSEDGSTVTVEVVVNANSLLPLFDVSGYGSHTARIVGS